MCSAHFLPPAPPLLLPHCTSTAPCTHAVLPSAWSIYSQLPYTTHLINLQPILPTCIPDPILISAWQSSASVSQIVCLTFKNI